MTRRRRSLLGVPLTPSEVAVIEARGRNEPLKAIAADLGVEISTVATWQARAVVKLGAAHRIDAARKWQRMKRRT